MKYVRRKPELPTRQQLSARKDQQSSEPLGQNGKQDGVMRAFGLDSNLTRRNQDPGSQPKRAPIPLISEFEAHCRDVKYLKYRQSVRDVVQSVRPMWLDSVVPALIINTDLRRCPTACIYGFKNTLTTGLAMDSEAEKRNLELLEYRP